MQPARRPFLQFLNGYNRTLRKQYCSATAPPLIHAKHFDEIEIKVPWGHISGKWYGPRHVRPVVGLHGWQDNAGTFDTLAPLLSPQTAFLSLDLPGHGLSSWLPAGLAYHSVDYVLLLRLLMEEFNWNKISILAHSMSSINSFIFSALFPEKVDMFIGLDILKPLIRSPNQVVDYYAERLEGFVKIDKRMRSVSEPPCYEWDELVDRLHNGTSKSVDKEACKYLLHRNIKPSEHEPHKYFFARDSRLKTSLFYPFSNEVVLDMASRIKCPHMFIKATRAPFYEPKEYFDEAIIVLQKNPLFQFHEVDGTHHVHLNEPEKIADLVNEFIKTHRT